MWSPRRDEAAESRSPHTVAGKAARTPTTAAAPRTRRPLQAGAAASVSPSPPPSSLPIFECDVMTVDPGEAVARRWYNVRLVCRLRPDLSWRVTRRYSDFDSLATDVEHEARTHGVCLPPLPPKLPSLLLSAAELQRRVLGLQRWSQHVLSSPVLLGHPAVLTFFNLSFGLWYVVDAVAAPALVLDPAQQCAATTIQAAARRMRQQHNFREALRAATLLQLASRRALVTARRRRQAAVPAIADMAAHAALSDAGAGTQPRSSHQKACFVTSSGRRPAAVAFPRRRSQQRPAPPVVVFFEGMQQALGMLRPR